MSFRSALNSPALVTAAGVGVAVTAPLVRTGALSLGILQAANVLTFGINVASVSVSGRNDGNQDSEMRQGNLNPESSTTRLIDNNKSDDNLGVYGSNRTLLKPAGWAFAIWGPIYLGELAFTVAQFVGATGLADILPAATVPICAANLFQSLWCASFRPSYDEGSWQKYVSVLMLGGTACSLSFLPADASLFLVPFVMKFGWTTAATLVNLNRSVALSPDFTDSQVVAAGHFSSVLATILGLSLTLTEFSTPVYGLTISWALAAVANGMSTTEWPNDTLTTGSRVQKALCMTGSILCLAAAAFVSIS